MGVYIKGMEMPNKKNGAVLIIYPDGKCAFEDGRVFDAIPIPPHGDLIDRDALPTSRVEWEDIVNAPTILEAEEGE